MRTKISCSSLARVAACPRSAQLEALAPFEPFSPAAEHGKYLHEVMAKTKPDSDLDDNDRYAIDWCRRKVDELDKQVFGEDVPSISVEVELRRGGKYWGRADRMSYSKGTLLCIDYKFGRGGTDSAEENYQLAGYAVGAKNHMIVHKCYVAILQPLSGNEPTLAEYSFDQLEEMDKKIDEIIAKAESKDAPLIPSMDACRYCRARATCPALEGERALIQSITAITQVNAREYWQKAQMVISHCEGIIENIKTMVMAADDPSKFGFQMKEGKSVRQITDLKAAWEALQDKMSVEQFLACCKGSVSSLEDAYKDAAGLKGKEAKDQFKARMEGCIELKQNKPSVEVMR